MTIRKLSGSDVGAMNSPIRRPEARKFRVDVASEVSLSRTDGGRSGGGFFVLCGRFLARPGEENGRSSVPETRSLGCMKLPLLRLESAVPIWFRKIVEVAGIR